MQNLYGVCLALIVVLTTIDLIRTETCNESTCRISDYKRCNRVFSYNQSEDNYQCQCLKGLHNLNDKCIGVVRYDFSMYLFTSLAFLNQSDLSSKIRQIFIKMPSSVRSNVINNMNHQMDVESTMYDTVDGLQAVKLYSKVIIWKKNAKSPVDLPALTLDQMNATLADYFSQNVLFDSKNNLTLVDDLTIGFGDYRSLFRSTFSLQYNQWTCSSDMYNYCSDYNLCTASLGGVKCKCNGQVSVDVSPQRDLFPGEKCQFTCDKPCYNGGLCMFKDGSPTCFCSEKYVGFNCEIDIILFSIIVLVVIFIFALLSILCGICDCMQKKNDGQKYEKRKSEKNN